MHQTLAELVNEQIEKNKSKQIPLQKDQLIKLRWYSEIWTLPNPDSWLKNAPKCYNTKTTPILQYSTDGGKTWLVPEEFIADYSKKELTG